MKLDELLACYVDENTDPKDGDKENALFAAGILVSDLLRALEERGYLDAGESDAVSVWETGWDYFLECQPESKLARASTGKTEHEIDTEPELEPERAPTVCCACGEDSEGAPICATCRRAYLSVFQARAARAGNQPFLLPELQATGSAQGTLFG